MDLRNKILSADDLPSERVTLGPEYDNAVVLMKGLSTGDRLALAKRHTTQVEGGDAEVDMVTMIPEMIERTAFDPDTGAALFGPGDAAVIATKSATGLDELVQVALRLNGFVNVEKTAGNSEVTPASSQLSE